MDYTHRYRAYPSDQLAEALNYHLDIHRQAYNHTRYEYNNKRNQSKIGSAYSHQKRLTGWKEDFSIFDEVHSKALQKTVERFYDNLSTLKKKKDKGHKVGELQWKSPREYQSITYSQSGFELKNTSGSDTNTATLWLSKIGDVPIRYHRSIPDHATIKEVTIKRETTGEWYVSFSLDVDEERLPDKIPADELDGNDCVGIDLGILNYVHTSDGLSLESLNLDSEYERLKKAQRVLSRREHGSNNWEKQRKRVAKIKRRIRRKVLDYQHKITSWLTTEYEAVFVEDLDVKPMLEQSHNARHKQDVAWSQFIELLEYKADLNGCHIEKVKPAGTSKECSECGAESDKPVWVREHSCPSCGFELDRDWNASINVLERGLELLGERLGLGQSEVERLKETGTSVGTLQREVVPTSAVVETGSPYSREQGSPVLKSRTVATVSD
jgi:putative transposase